MKTLSCKLYSNGIAYRKLNTLKTADQPWPRKSAELDTDDGNYVRWRIFSIILSRDDWLLKQIRSDYFVSLLNGAGIYHGMKWVMIMIITPSQCTRAEAILFIVFT